MSIELKPCPFCNSDRIGDHHIRDGRSIGCKDCGASVHAFMPDALLTASRKWNTRADTSSDAAAMAVRWIDAKAQLATKDSEIKRLREALERISRQKKTDELETEYDVECASFEDGFDLCVDVARSALSPIPDPAGGMPVEVERTRCHGQTAEPDFNGYCPVCHDDMSGAAR